MATKPQAASAAGAKLRIAVDIGGTFTDMAAFDEASGKLLFGKALSTHGQLVDGIQATLDSAEHRPARRPAVPARLDHRDQHAARAQRRQDRAADHRRLPRHLRDRPRQPARRLQPVLQQAPAAGQALAALRGGRAPARRRQLHKPLDEAAVRALARRAEGQGHRGGRRAAAAFLPQPGARAARQGRSCRRSCRASSSPPRTSCRRNTASSSASRPSWPTPMSARACRPTSASSSSIWPTRASTATSTSCSRPAACSPPSTPASAACACWSPARRPA